ncbi:hypothetical protein [Chlorobium limicola]
MAKGTWATERAEAEAQASVAAERQQNVAEAREHAAGLAGQLEAITAQNRELMDALKR